MLQKAVVKGQITPDEKVASVSRIQVGCIEIFFCTYVCTYVNLFLFGFWFLKKTTQDIHDFHSVDFVVEAVSEK